MRRLFARTPLVRTVATLAGLALVAAAAVTVVRMTSQPTRRVVAHFAAAVGVHIGSDVRVLGVRVGEVLAVTPQGRTVRVEMTYQSRVDIPADAKAVVVPPSVVSDRYIQFTPAYTGGAVLADGADLPLARTVVPIEIDEIYRTLDQLNQALGPNGANAKGALSGLVDTARANLDGNGERLHDTLAGFAQALSTLAEGRDDLFGTVANLATFTNALARSDAQVREFNQRLAAVAGQLAAERDDLAAAVKALAAALADIKGFVHDNRAALVADVGALADVTGILVRQQKALIDVLDLAPLALSNLHLAYNARSGTLDTRDDVLGPYDPASYVCSLMATTVPAPQIPQACFDLVTLLNRQHVPLPDALKRLLRLIPRPGSAAPASTGLSSGPDRTMAGILTGGA